jgi:hypothetical protein
MPVLSTIDCDPAIEELLKNPKVVESLRTMSGEEPKMKSRKREYSMGVLYLSQVSDASLHDTFCVPDIFDCSSDVLVVDTHTGICYRRGSDEFLDEDELIGRTPPKKKRRRK